MQIRMLVTFHLTNEQRRERRGREREREREVTGPRSDGSHSRARMERQGR